DWTDAATAEAAMSYVLEARARRRRGLRLKPFYTEMVGYRWSDQAAFEAGLAVAGPRAVTDFARAMDRWQSGGKVPGRIETGEEG
ncbi:MAG TPA: deiodinase-related protein, partial [Thermomicrobiales bacterium]|nr:deiodinase-related protein [Thermomicrobiales bacterium]